MLGMYIKRNVSSITTSTFLLLYNTKYIINFQTRYILRTITLEFVCVYAV